MAFLTEHGLETLLTDLKDVFARLVHTHDDRYYTETETDTHIGQAVAKVEEGIAYRLGNTNTTGAALPVGTYVYVSGNSTLAEGMYKVSTAITSGGTLSASNCTAVSGGGLNALNADLATTAAEAQDKMGFYIDNSGYLCQRISSDN